MRCAFLNTILATKKFVPSQRKRTWHIKKIDNLKIQTISNVLFFYTTHNVSFQNPKKGFIHGCRKIVLFAAGISCQHNPVEMDRDKMGHYIYLHYTFITFMHRLRIKAN